MIECMLSIITLRCNRCRKVLLRGEIQSGKFTIQCARCHTKNTYCFSFEKGRIFGREVEEATAEIS